MLYRFNQCLLINEPVLPPHMCELWITKSERDDALSPPGVCSNSMQSHSGRRTSLKDFFSIQAFHKQSSQTEPTEEMTSLFRVAYFTS